MKYIRGRRAKESISKEIGELKEALGSLAQRDCCQEEQVRCEKRVKKFEELYKERISLEERVSSMKVAGRFEEDLEAKVAILEELDYLKSESYCREENLPHRFMPRNY